MKSQVSSEPKIQTTAVDFSFGELLNLHRDKEIVIQPEYQRLFRWNNDQRSRLIESILLDLPLPPIFLIENESGVLELIDGLQRTSSVIQFLDNTSLNLDVLVLSGCDILQELNGLTFEGLDLVRRLKIKRTPIRAIIIGRSGDQFVKYELFKRLNTGGSLLSAQEIRNCACRMVVGGTEFYEAIQSMALNRDFVRATSRLPQAYVDLRQNEELVLRFFALKNGQESYKGNIESWLDGYMEDVLFARKPFHIDVEGAAFEETFSLIVEKFDDQAFTRFNAEQEAVGRLAPAYFEAVCATVMRNADAIRAVPREALQQRLRDAFSSVEFKAATGPGANSIAKLHERIAVVQRHLIENGIS